MKNRDEIEPGHYYEVALQRSGRGGRRIVQSEVCKVTAAPERNPWYTESVRYHVQVTRMLMKGLVIVYVEPRDVLRRVTDAAEVEVAEKNWRFADEWGWVHKETARG